MSGKNLLKSARARLYAVWGTAVAVVLGLVDTLLMGLDLFAGVGEVIWAVSGTLFSALSISAFTLGEQIPALPTELLSQLAIFVGLIYVARLLVKIGQKIRSVE